MPESDIPRGKIARLNVISIFVRIALDLDFFGSKSTMYVFEEKLLDKNENRARKKIGWRAPFSTASTIHSRCSAECKALFTIRICHIFYCDYSRTFFMHILLRMNRYACQPNDGIIVES